MPSVRGSTVREGNRLLDSLPPAERGRIAGAVDEIRLELKEQLYNSGERIDSVYFPLGSVVSLLTRVEGTPGVEVATIGNEGLVGVSLSWGATTLNPADILQVQVPGGALRMDARAFTAELARGAGLASVVRRYTQAFVSQLSQQVACNGLHSIEERCARWLLLTHDRVGADEFPLTQEFLAQMLGVRRASVTVVAGTLQQAGFIRYGRGRVRITDRAGLEQTSCQCYPVLREVFDRLIP
jgi:CRP-like cAMP-binding protein